MMGPADADVMLAAAPMGGKLAAAAVAEQAETAGGKEQELADTTQAAAAAGFIDRDAEFSEGDCSSSGGAAGVVLPAVAIAAAGRTASGWAESHVPSARASVTSGCGSGCWALEDGCGCGCSTLPRLRRLEAEQVGGGAWLCSA
jgi:hypothetical protein